MAIKTLKVEGKHELSIKRCYLPITLETQCPHCNMNNVKDFGDDYLSYPVTNTKMDSYVYCDHCENEYSFKIELSITLEVDTATTKL